MRAPPPPRGDPTSRGGSDPGWATTPPARRAASPASVAPAATAAAPDSRIACTETLPPIEVGRAICSPAADRTAGPGAVPSSDSKSRVHAASWFAAARSSPRRRCSRMSSAWLFSSSGLISTTRVAQRTASSSSPRDINAWAASCRTASDAARRRCCSESSQASNPAAPRTLTPSSSVDPRPGRPSACVQVPRVTTSTSTTASSGKRSCTGSPSSDAATPSPRRTSARFQRRARSGSSASSKSRPASLPREGGRSAISR